MDEVQTRTRKTIDLRFKGVRLFLFLAASLSSTILLKVGEIQYLEIIYFLQICLLVAMFPRRGFRTRNFRPAFRMGWMYAIFMVVTLISALAALRSNFYFPSGMTLLKGPVWITISRIGELTIDAGAMLYLVKLFYTNIENLIFALRVYFWVGVASSVYSIVTFPLNYFFGLQLGTYYNLHRMRGFLNEGGPFGLYMISEILIAMVLSRQGWIGRKSYRIGMCLIVIGVFGSQSKSAIFVALLMLVFNALMVKQMGQRLVVLGVVVLIVGITLSVPNISDELVVYWSGPENFEYTSNFSYADGNYVYGRIAGAFLVPRMIKAHPWLGVGWGNYGLVRDDPQYRGASAFVDFNDGPGLGLLALSAEVGIPALVFLLCILFYPYFYLRKINAPLVIKNLALMQPMAHIFGANLNVTYPWLLTAFAFGLGYFYKHHELAGYEPAPAAGSLVAGIAPPMTGEVGLIQ
jgi:hypothetical protein